MCKGLEARGVTVKFKNWRETSVATAERMSIDARGEIEPILTFVNSSLFILKFIVPRPVLISLTTVSHFS